VIFPEWALRPTDGELAGPVCEFIAKESSLASAAVSVASPGYTVPDGKLLIAQSVISFADPGAAQNVVDHILRLFWPAGFAQYLKYQATALAVNINNLIDDAEVKVYPPGVKLDSIATFNAGVASNIVTFNVIGWLIPRSSVVI
jgi:hypothetical protein